MRQPDYKRVLLNPILPPEPPPLLIDAVIEDMQGEANREMDFRDANPIVDFKPRGTTDG